MTGDPLGLTNLFTRAGLLATDASAVVETDALDTDVAESAAILGFVAPAKTVPFTATEPAPDAFAELGDSLELKRFDDPLFLDDTPLPDQPVQGFLDNCPLVAVLTAMVHVPRIRGVVRHHVVRERTKDFSTSRTRMVFEYKQNDPARSKPMKRLPGPTSNFEDDRVFDVTFFTNLKTLNLGPNGDILLHTIGPTTAVTATPVYYRHASAAAPLKIFYAHSTRRELYPSAVEKAYVYHHSPANNPNYQEINDGLPLADVMYELAGYSRQGWIVAPDASVVALSTKRLRRWLDKHHTRPTVLGSKSGLAQGAPIVSDHAYPVISRTSTHITVVNVLKERGEADRTVTLPIGDVDKYFFFVVQGPEEYAQTPASGKHGDID